MRLAHIANSALTEPPMLVHLLFEQPLILSGGFIAIALALLALGIRRQNVRWMIGAAVLATASAMVYGTAYFVVTDREQIIELTRQAIQCTTTDPIDIDGLKGLIAPDAAIFGPDDRRWLSCDQCLTRLGEFLQFNPIREQTLVAIQAQTTGADTGLTRIDLKTMTHTEIGNRPVMTRWLLTWGHTPEHRWVIQKIQWLVYPGTTGFNPSTVIKR